MNMRNLGRTALVGLGLVVMAATARANGLVNLEGKVDFGFRVEKTALPSGQYRVTAIDEDNQEALSIRSQDGKQAVDFLVEPVTQVKPSMQSELVFAKVGNAYHLAQIWLEGEATGYQVSDPSLQQALARTPEPIRTRVPMRRHEQ